MTITLLHQGFDGLDMTIECQIPATLAEIFESARERAGAARQVQLVTYKDIDFLVAETGAKGGFRYRCDTGPLGATWFFKKPRLGERWGAMVSWKSAPLTTLGVQTCIDRTAELLNAIGCNVAEADMLVGRVDYCLDYLMPEFDLDPCAFVMHARFKKDTKRPFLDEGGISDRAIAVRIGSPINKQVTIYDKRKEAIEKRKDWLWDLWNANFARVGLPPLSRSETKGMIWRVEFRIGKDFFRERYQIKTPTQFFAHAGHLFSLVASQVRQTLRTADSNRARRPDAALWADVRVRIASGLVESIGVIPENRVKEVERELLRECLFAQSLGIDASLAALNGYDKNDIGEAIELLNFDARDRLFRNHEKLSAKIADACGRYRFLD